MNNEEETEAWRPIKGYEERYLISNLGKIKNIKNRYGKEQILSPCVSKTSGGYYVVNLCVNGTQKTRTVHQLVAEAFLNHTPCGFKLVINHIDLNKLNNKASNLELVSNRVNTNMKHIKTSSQYTGVSYVKKKNKWRSNIVIEGKCYILGSTDNTEEEAKDKYDLALYNWETLGVKPIIRVNSSKHRGVSFNKRTQKWVCYVLVDDKRKSLGYHKTEKEAINAIKQFKNGQN